MLITSLMLLILFGVPIACFLIGGSLNRTYIFYITFFVSILLFFSVVTFIFYFNKSLGYFFFKLSFIYFELDFISLILLLLSVFIFLVCYIYVYNFINFSFKFYVLLLLFIEYIILLSFITNNLLIFYFLFESLLLPMLLLIGIGGSRGRKIHAAYQFFFYTVASSILLLCGISILYFEGGSLYFYDFYSIKIKGDIQILIGLLFFFGFLAKIPSFPLHIWLPEAHVEAPTVGSVILAAILLKFGYYGIVRVLVPICFVNTMVYLRPIFVLICFISLIYSSIACVRQIDLKKIIAYSSIVHMNFAVLGIFLPSQTGFSGSTFLMLSHGIISGSMFFCIGFLYERFHIRNIMYFGGLAQFMPVFSIFLLVIMFSNMSLPGTCNFIGEFLIFVSLSTFGYLSLLLALFSVILVAIFCLIILSRVIFYQLTGFLKNNLTDLNYLEFLIIFILSLYIIMLGIFPNLILNLFIFK